GSGETRESETEAPPGESVGRTETAGGPVEMLSAERQVIGAPLDLDTVPAGEAVHEYFDGWTDLAEAGANFLRGGFEARKIVGVVGNEILDLLARRRARP